MHAPYALLYIHLQVGAIGRNWLHHVRAISEYSPDTLQRQSSRFSVWVDCGRGHSNHGESSGNQLIFRQWPLLDSVESVERVRKVVPKLILKVPLPQLVL